MFTRAPSRGRAARLAGIVATATLAATLLPGTPPASAVPTPDPERTSTAPTGWGWHPNASPATIAEFAAQGNRIIDLEPTSGTPTFTVTYAQNSGSYARGWWWYYNLTAAEVSAKATEHGARILDLEQYTTGRGAVRYAVVLVHNVDPADKAWGSHMNVSAATIDSYVASNTVRIVDLDRTPSGAFNAVYISNTGVDAKQWWYYFGQTHAQVTSLLQANQARLTDIERTSDGKFDVVMQKRGSERWWWLTGATQAAVNDLQTQTGSRIYKSSSFVSGGQRLFDVLLIDNTDKETRRIRNAVSSGAVGQWGFYAKRVGGTQLAGLNHETKFEPASMIKILHAVHMMRDVQLGAPTINTNVTWYANPFEPVRYQNQEGYGEDKNICAYTEDGTLQTSRTYVDSMGLIIEQMMESSDNRTTDAVVLRYGFDALNATRALAGMTSSDLNHRIGCPAAASPQPFESNVLTLVDAGKIYEGVEQGTLLDDTHADMLYDRMWGWNAPTNATRTMILKEAANAGLTPAQQVQFADGIHRRAKGGSYGICRNNTCTQQRSISTDGGIVWVPVKGRGGVVVDRAYVHGRFLDTHETHDCVSSTDENYGAECGTGLSDFVRKIDLEVMRTIVRDALKTWVA